MVDDRSYSHQVKQGRVKLLSRAGRQTYSYARPDLFLSSLLSE